MCTVEAREAVIDRPLLFPCHYCTFDGPSATVEIASSSQAFPSGKTNTAQIAQLQYVCTTASNSMYHLIRELLAWVGIIGFTTPIPHANNDAIRLKDKEITQFDRAINSLQYLILQTLLGDAMVLNAEWHLFDTCD